MSRIRDICRVMSRCVALCRVVSRCVALCRVVSRYVSLFYVASCRVFSRSLKWLLLLFHLVLLLCQSPCFAEFWSCRPNLDVSRFSMSRFFCGCCCFSSFYFFVSHPWFADFWSWLVLIRLSCRA
jgi:hypothetical protein